MSLTRYKFHVTRYHVCLIPLFIPGTQQRAWHLKDLNKYLLKEWSSLKRARKARVGVCSVALVTSDSETPWTVACQASLSMGFPRQKDWSTGIEPTSAAPALLGGFITTVPPGKPMKRFAKIWMKLSIWPGFQPPHHCCIPPQTLETAQGRIQRLGFGVSETKTKSHFQLHV